jgi:hypothetical protein
MASKTELQLASSTWLRVCVVPDADGGHSQLTRCSFVEKYACFMSIVTEAPLHDAKVMFDARLQLQHIPPTKSAIGPIIEWTFWGYDSTNLMMSSKILNILVISEMYQSSKHMKNVVLNYQSACSGLIHGIWLPSEIPFNYIVPSVFSAPQVKQKLPLQISLGCVF